MQQIEQGFATMVKQGQAELMAEGVSSDDITINYLVDLRYVGQSYTLPIPWQNEALAIKAFHAMHKSRYGHDLELAVELVNLRTSLTGEMPTPNLTQQSERLVADAIPVESGKGMRIYQREKLMSNDVIKGEALIVEQVATTYLAPSWQCKVDVLGNLVLSKLNAIEPSS